MNNSFGERMKKGVKREIEGIPAELGRHEAGGSYTVPTGQLNEVFARLYGDDNNLVTATNLLVQPKSQLPVRVRQVSEKHYIVIGTDPSKIGIFLGEDAPGASIPPSRGANLTALWESYQFKPGSIRALTGTGLQVWMEGLSAEGSELGNISGNMATVVGSITASKKTWVLVSVDPATNILSFTKGTEYPLTVPLTRALAYAVAVPDGEIPLWTYAMRAGDTNIPVQKRSLDTEYFVDRRPWITLATILGSSTSLPNFGAPAIVTLASGVAAAGANRNLTLAAQTGTTDDLTEITGLSVGDEIIISADAGDTITVVHNDSGATVKVLLYNSTDLDLTGEQTLKLVLRDTNKLVQYVDEKGSAGITGFPVSFSFMFDEALAFDISDTPIVLQVGNEGGGHPYVTSFFQSVTPNIGDYFTIPLFMAAGTYTLYILGSTNTNRGKLTWDLDGGTPITTVDDWGVSSSANIVHTFSMIVPTDGNHILTGTVSAVGAGGGKYFSLTKVWAR